MLPTSIEELYKWEPIDTIEKTEKEECFLQEELKLANYGIRTKVEINHSQLTASLLVPLKDAEVARDLLFNGVYEIIDLPVETYHVFEKDLSYKNEALYEDKYHRNLKGIRIRSYIIMAFVLLMMLLFFRFVKFS